MVHYAVSALLKKQDRLSSLVCQVKNEHSFLNKKNDKGKEPKGRRGATAAKSAYCYSNIAILVLYKKIFL